MIASYELLARLCTTAGSSIQRARRRADRASALLNVLDPSPPVPEQAGRFRREYDIVTSLDLPGVIEPVAFIDGPLPAMETAR